MPEIRPAADRREFAAALSVRVRVFVDEQAGPLDEEPDGWDDSARHFVVILGGEIVGTARLYFPETGVGKIGRVALLPGCRGRGWGDLLLRALLEHAAKLGVNELVLDAQTAAVPFYERFGFRTEGEEFIDAGIPHRRMRRTAAPAPGRAPQESRGRPDSGH